MQKIARAEVTTVDALRSPVKLLPTARLASGRTEVSYLLDRRADATPINGSARHRRPGATRSGYGVRVAVKTSSRRPRSITACRRSVHTGRTMPP